MSWTLCLRYDFTVIGRLCLQLTFLAVIDRNCQLLAFITSSYWSFNVRMTIAHPSTRLTSEVKLFWDDKYMIATVLAARVLVYIYQCISSD